MGLWSAAGVGPGTCAVQHMAPTGQADPDEASGVPLWGTALRARMWEGQQLGGLSSDSGCCC